MDVLRKESGRRLASAVLSALSASIILMLALMLSCHDDGILILFFVPGFPYARADPPRLSAEELC